MKNLLFSPMVIMTVVMLGMTAFMQNIDPNTLKEMQNQGNGDAPPRPEDPAALISDFLH
jgi:cell division protein FtsN